MSYRIIYTIICSITLPVIVLVNFKSAGAEPCPANIFASVGIGFVAGFCLGLMKDRGEALRHRLEGLVGERTEELTRKAKELETSRKQTAVLRDLLPVCPSCRSIKNNQGDRQQLETYLQNYSAGRRGDNVCSDCSPVPVPNSVSHQLGQQPAAG